MSYPFTNILRALYGGHERPEDSPGQLRALADWMDDIDNAADKELTSKSTRTMQVDLRRIATELEEAHETIKDLRASVNDMMEQMERNK
jgi:hypothetical protein